MRKNLLKLTVFLVCGAIAIGAAVPMVAASVSAKESVVPYVQRMIRDYRDNQNPDSWVIRNSLEKIAELDPEAGECWSLIMEDWAYCNELVPDDEVLRDGLPEDDSMCMVVLGFELNPDGSMKPELISRLRVALRSHKKYPNAYIAVTGGGTAAKSDMTEAKAMAAWLIEQGVPEGKLIVEDQAMSTTYNAVNTYAILVEDYPQVTGVAIITSDYHIPWGATLFQTVCDYHTVYGETAIPVIACAANPTFTTTDTMTYQARGICTITGIPYKK